jgi:hypothetical protein
MKLFNEYEEQFLRRVRRMGNANKILVGMSEREKTNF